MASTPVQSPERVHCSYQSKPCENVRAMKQNGKLHKLCEFHRRKANMSQMRMQQRRRMMKRHATDKARKFNSNEWVTLISDTLEPFTVPCDGLLDADISVLECILFDSTETNSNACT